MSEFIVIRWLSRLRIRPRTNRKDGCEHNKKPYSPRKNRSEIQISTRKTCEDKILQPLEHDATLTSTQVTSKFNSPQSTSHRALVGEHICQRNSDGKEAEADKPSSRNSPQCQIPVVHRTTQPPKRQRRRKRSMSQPILKSEPPRRYDALLLRRETLDQITCQPLSLSEKLTRWCHYTNFERPLPPPREKKRSMQSSLYSGTSLVDWQTFAINTAHRRMTRV